MYRQLVFEKITYGILLFTSLVVVVNGIFKLNILKLIPNPLTYIIYFTIMLSIVYNIFRRDYYLPFLGNTVYPCNSLTLKTPENANVMRKVSDLRPNVNVVFWASESSEDKVIDNPWDAYDTYSNAGVTISDSNGNATFMVRTPTPYKIPSGFVLDNHIHYRECIGKGILGPVKTLML